HPSLPPGGHRRHARPPSPRPRRGGHRLCRHLAGDPGHGVRWLDHDRAVPLRRRPRRGGPDRPGARLADHGHVRHPLRVYAQLLRPPTLPSALADLCLGAVALAAQPPVGRLAEGFPFAVFALLLFSSACLYSSGMVWNDYFDLAQDRRERPFRPLPSGRVKPNEAARLGTGLMVVGVACALMTGRLSGSLALVLVLAILAYDGWLKRTWAGPLGMGLCRFLNVLLGVSLAGTLDVPWALHLAAVVGLYIVGVTWFARTEARESNQSALQGAAAVM